MLRLQHALPSYYVHYYYQHDSEVAQQAAPGTGPGLTSWPSWRPRCWQEYRDPALVSKPEALSYRGGAYYSLAAMRLMASLHDGSGDVQVVDMRNDGAIPGLPDDAVVETRAVVDAPAPTLCRSGSCHPRCSVSSSTPRPTSAWP